MFIKTSGFTDEGIDAVIFLGYVNQVLEPFLPGVGLIALVAFEDSEIAQTK